MDLTKSRAFLWLQENILSVFILFLLTLVFFWRVPLQGRVLLPLDTLFTYEPWRSEVPGALGVQVRNPWLSDGIRHYYPLFNFVQASWRQGQVPFWNPYALAGMPVLASGIDQVFYPLTLLLLLTLSTAQAISWATILHTFLGSLFCFLFIRELGTGRVGALIGAVSFVFGALIYWMPALPTFQAIIWLPLLFWSFERAVKYQNWRWSVVGGLILGLQIVAGNVQMVYYSLTGLGFYALYHAWFAWLSQQKLSSGFRPLWFLSLMVLIGAGLTAIQSLPILELVPLGVRGEVDFNPEFSWKILLRLFVPDILGTDLDLNLTPSFAHELYLYFGLLPLLFIIAAAFSPYRRPARFLIGLGLLVWLVIFKIPPFYQVFATLYPTFNVLGFHRAQILIAFGWAAASGLGADWIYAHRPISSLKWLLFSGTALLTAMIVLALWLAFISKYQARFWWNLPSLEAIEPAVPYLLASVIFSSVILAVGLAILWQWQQGRMGQTVFGITILAFVVIDIFLVHLDYVSALEPNMLYPETPSLSYLKNLTTQETQPYRMVSAGRLFWGNDATVFGLNDIQGYDPFLLKRYSDYLDLAQVRSESNHRIAAFTARTSKLLDMLNVKYYYVPRYKLADGEWVSLLTEVDDPAVQSNSLSGEQTADWIINGWPQKVLLAPPSSKISYRGYLQYPAQLETAIAIDPQSWTHPDVDVLFEVYVQSTNSPTEKLLFSKHLTGVTSPDNMQWTPVLVDLSDYAHQEVIVSFVTSGPSPWPAGWADPLIMDSSKVDLLYYGPNSIYRNKNSLPRAWVVHQVDQVPEGDLEAVKAVLSNPAFQPVEQAVIEGKLSALLAPKQSDEPIEFVTYTPNYAKIKAQLSAPGVLILSDIYYPGWNVYVDGVPTHLYAANLMMRGVPVAAGVHDIEFKYEPMSFKIGMYVSLATLILVVVVFVVDWKKSSANKRQGISERSNSNGNYA
ncbi:MAG: YfhO family protein [Anaerolineae bacterium]